MTASALAKRSSREFRPAVSRRGSETSNSDKDPKDGQTNIKPSKSLHSKLTVPLTGTARLSTSSSLGSTASYVRGGLVSSPSLSPVEDEETLGDAEMAAYVKRRLARKSSSGGKHDDLSDIKDFPEDIEPAEPLTQRAFVQKNLSMLSDNERREVLDFDYIYYTSPQKIKRPTQPGGAVYNHGYDDERGDYLVVEGDHLCYRYEIVGILGKGSFGQVVGCRDHKTGGSVAVKIIRNKKRFHAQALVEVKILQQLVEWVNHFPLFLIS